MIHSESIKELAGALAKAQGLMEAASKDRKNQFGGVYADLGSVIEAAKKPLAANGLSISQHPEIADGRVSVTTILMHASGEWLESSISSTVRENNALSAAQQAGIVITYLRRYALASIVGIYADEDTDGNEKAEKKTAPVKAQPAQNTPQEQATIDQLYPPEPQPTKAETIHFTPANVQMAKLGGNKGHGYPASWVKEVMIKIVSTGKANEFEADGILQKLALDTATVSAETAVAEIEKYLAAKAAQG